MTRPKELSGRYPVASFSPDLLEVLLRGARERLELPCPDQRTMKHIQLRLQMLRGAMRRENHPQATLVMRARTSRTWDKGGDKNKNCVLLVYPNDSQFADIFRKAGITTDIPRDILDDMEAPLAPPTAPPSPDPIVPDEPDPYQKWKKLI